jgi:hypothetical protein
MSRHSRPQYWIFRLKLNWNSFVLRADQEPPAHPGENAQSLGTLLTHGKPVTAATTAHWNYSGTLFFSFADDVGI